MEYVIILYLLITIFLCYIQIRTGIVLYLFYFILIPYNNLYSINLNTVFPFILLSAYFINFGFYKLLIKPLLPFLFLFLFEFILIPIRDQVPYKTQFYFFLADFTKVVLPFVMFNIMYKDPRYIFVLTKVLLFCIGGVVFYTLFLVLIPGANPYLSNILPLSGEEFLDWYASPERSGRIFGRISSVFPHPMTNGLFLSLSLIFLFFLIQISTSFSKKINLYILLFLNLAAIFVMGVRTSILSIAITVIVYLIIERKLKTIISIILGLGLFSLILIQIQGMDDYIASIFDSNSTDIGGSSIEMRISQLSGAFYEIRNNFIFGNGYGWSTQYQILHGNHPVLFAFESLFFMVICNSGFFGIGLWLIMILLYLKHIYMIKKANNTSIFIALITLYITYSLITGEYSYMKYFLLFYSVIYMQTIYRQNEELKIKN